MKSQKKTESLSNSMKKFSISDFRFSQTLNLQRTQWIPHRLQFFFFATPENPRPPLRRRIFGCRIFRRHIFSLEKNLSVAFWSSAFARPKALLYFLRAKTFSPKSKGLSNSFSFSIWPARPEGPLRRRKIFCNVRSQDSISFHF